MESERVRGYVINVHALGAAVRLEDGRLFAVPIGDVNKNRAEYTRGVAQRGLTLPFDLIGRTLLLAKTRADEPIVPTSEAPVLVDPDLEAQIANYMKSTESWAPAIGLNHSNVISFVKQNARRNFEARKRCNANPSVVTKEAGVEPVKVPGSFVRIEGAYASLRAAEQRVADFILKHPDELIYLTVTELADARTRANRPWCGCARRSATRAIKSSKSCWPAISSNRPARSTPKSNRATTSIRSRPKSFKQTRKRCVTRSKCSTMPSSLAQSQRW